MLYGTVLFQAIHFFKARQIWNKTLDNLRCSYTWKMQMYMREHAGLAQKTKQGTIVVLDLAEVIDNSCQIIIGDNFFTNPLMPRIM